MTAAYGLRLGGADGPADWPEWSLRTHVAAADDRAGLSVWPDRARVGLPGLGEVRIDRTRRAVVVATARVLALEALVHPGLASVAAVVAHWDGRAALHAAAVTHDGAAWALLAARGGGKSTTAALLCSQGCDLVTDDVLVVAGGRALAGPPSVDLRPDAARLLGGDPLPHRDRIRRVLDRPLFEAPLAGFVSLVWGRSVAVRALPAAERLTALRTALVLPAPGSDLLALAALPMLEARRPHDLDAARSGVGSILAEMRK